MTGPSRLCPPTRPADTDASQDILDLHNPSPEASAVIADVARAHGVTPAFALARLQAAYPKLRWYGPASFAALVRAVLS